MALLARRYVAPRLFVIKLTERGQNGQLNNIGTNFSELANAGIQIAVDDFGTGYPTLAQLKQIPLNQLKIDKSLVLGMLTDERDATVVKATIDIVRQRGLEIVAEGVELQSHWDALTSLGVDAAQGFLVAHPMNYDDLIAWLDAATGDRDTWEPRSATG